MNWEKKKCQFLVQIPDVFDVSWVISWIAFPSLLVKCISSLTFQVTDKMCCLQKSLKQHLAGKIFSSHHPRFSRFNDFFFFFLVFWTNISRGFLELQTQLTYYICKICLTGAHSSKAEDLPSVGEAPGSPSNKTKNKTKNPGNQSYSNNARLLHSAAPAFSPAPESPS